MSLSLPPDPDDQTVEPWTVAQEREALSYVLDRASQQRGTDVPSAMWGAARALVEMKEQLRG